MYQYHTLLTTSRLVITVWRMKEKIIRSDLYCTIAMQLNPITKHTQMITSKFLQV